VRTQVGQGSEFEIRLPASLGVLRALVVVSDGHRYCVDASQVVDRCELGKKNLDFDQAFVWRREILPVVGLRTLLAQPMTEPSSTFQVLVCDLPSETGNGEANNRHAIVVEAIEGSQEVLVRGLGRHTALWPGVVGATELWDGTIALVLDLPLLLSVSRRQVFPAV
jgi:two-component system chemotaxis sensor kinase CheA